MLAAPKQKKESQPKVTRKPKATGKRGAKLRKRMAIAQQRWSWR